MRECRAEGCPHLAADGCDYCKQHDEPSQALPDQSACAEHGPFAPARFCCACTRAPVEAERDRLRAENEALRSALDGIRVTAGAAWQNNCGAESFGDIATLADIALADGAGASDETEATK